MNASKCLLRKYDEKLCVPTNGLYLGLHGYDGNGGRVAASSVPREYRGILLEDSPAKDSQEDVYRKLAGYAKSFDKMFEDVREARYLQGESVEEVRIKSLYLWSAAPGTGKTTTASALLNEYLLKYYVGTLKRKQSPKQRPVYFLDANALQVEYSSFNRPRVPDDIAEPAARRYYHEMERAKHTDFVVIDDLATRETTEGFRDDLHSIINHRVTNHLPTIYTSNVPIADLPQVFGDQRLPDRIRDMTLAIHFEGESQRGIRR